MALTPYGIRFVVPAIQYKVCNMRLLILIKIHIVGELGHISNFFPVGWRSCC